jgi:hypothetical protein
MKLFGKHIVADLSKAIFDTEERKKLSKKHEALPDGSFPIRNESDLRNAIHDVGISKNPEKAKRWIKRRANELKLEHLLPEEWK